MHTMTTSRYLTIAHLLEPSAWPMGVSLRDDDVLVHGESLAAQGRVTTPAVRIGEATPPPAANSSVPQRFVSLVIARVLAVTPPQRHGHADVTIDADLSRCEAHFSEMHVVGRRPAHRTARVRLHATGAVDGPRVRLPRDIVAGDILVIPCDGTVTPGDVRCCPAAVDGDADDDAPVCGRHLRGRS